MALPVHLPSRPVAAAALALCGLAAPLAAQSTVPLGSKAAYVHVNGDAATAATPIALAPLGVTAGQCVRLRVLGDFDFGPQGDDFQNTIGVFSADSTLVAPALLNRVPGALDAGVDFLTTSTFIGNQATDIPQDFAITYGTEITEVTVKVPAGAHYLFAGPNDHYFQDNSDPDGDYRLEITVVGCWTDLGLGLAGATGTPVLAGTGTLFANDAAALALTGARPSSSAALIVGLGLLNAPFKGGTLVPSADVIVAGLPTDPTGAFTLPFAWPAGLPSGFSLNFQMWIADPTAPQGFSASNGLSATTP